MSRMGLYQGPQFSGNDGYTRGRLPANRGPSGGQGTGANRAPQDTLLDQMGRVIGQDVRDIRAAEEENRIALGGVTKDFSSFLGGIDGVVSGAQANATGILDDEAGRIDMLAGGADAAFSQGTAGIADRVAAGANRARELFGEVTGAADQAGAEAMDFARQGVGAAQMYGDKAIGAAQDAAGSFGESRLARIAEETKAIEKRYANDLKMMEGGWQSANMSPAEFAAFKRETMFDVGQHTSRISTEINSAYDFKQADLNMAIANVTLAAGQMVTDANARAAATSLGAGELRMRAAEAAARGELDATAQEASVKLAISGQGLEAERIKQGYAQIAASLREQSAMLAQTMPLAALQMRMQGFTAMYQMIQSNPRRPVSRFAALVELAKIATAPGGRNQRPITGFNV
jgi:hypothetical protein